MVEIDEIRSGVWDDKILVSLGVEPEKPPVQEEDVPEPQVTEKPQVQEAEEEMKVQEKEEAVQEVAMVSLSNRYLRDAPQRICEGGRGRIATRRSNYGDPGRASFLT